MLSSDKLHRRFLTNCPLSEKELQKGQRNRCTSNASNKQAKLGKAFLISSHHSTGSLHASPAVHELKEVNNIITTVAELRFHRAPPAQRAVKQEGNPTSSRICIGRARFSWLIYRRIVPINDILRNIQLRSPSVLFGNEG